MAEKTYEDKTEKATPKKRQEARKKGEVPRSKELPSVAVLLSSLITLSISLSYMYTHIKIIMGKSFFFPFSNEFHIHSLMSFGRDIITLFLLALGPLFVAIVVSAVFSNVMQFGVLFSMESIKPKISKTLRVIESP